MFISVIYKNGKCSLVHNDFLDYLIALEQVDKFLRLEGWVTVGVDPLRSAKDNYHGIEKRQGQMFSNMKYFHDFKLDS